MANFNIAPTTPGDTTSPGGGNFNVQADNPDNSGLLGALLSGIGFTAAGVATTARTRNPIIGGAAATAGGGVGSVAGNVIEEVARDFLAGRDPSISQAEAWEIVKNAGIDVVSPGVFKLAGKTITGIGAKFLNWLPLFKGGAGAAAIVNAIKNAAEVAPALRLGAQSVSEFLHKAAPGVLIKVSEKPKIMERITKDWKELWASAYETAAKHVPKDGIPIDPAIGNQYTKITSDGLMKVANAIRTGSLKGIVHGFDEVTEAIASDSRTSALILDAAQVQIDKFLANVKDDAVSSVWKAIKVFLGNTVVHGVNNLAGSYAQTPEGDVVQLPLNKGGIIAYANKGLPGISDARIERLIEEAQLGNIMDAGFAWIELALANVEKASGFDNVLQQAAWLMFVLIKEGSIEAVNRAHEIDLPPLPENIAKFGTNAIDMLIVVFSNVGPLSKRIPKKAKKQINAWAAVTVLGAPAFSVITGKDVASRSEIDDWLYENRPAGVIQGVLTGLFDTVSGAITTPVRVPEELQSEPWTSSDGKEWRALDGVVYESREHGLTDIDGNLIDTPDKTFSLGKKAPQKYQDEYKASGGQTIDGWTGANTGSLIARNRAAMKRMSQGGLIAR